MKVVIFGAGASYDCIPKYYNGVASYETRLWEPPLTKDIFADRKSFLDIRKKYVGADDLSAEANIQNNIEEFLGRIMKIGKDKKDEYRTRQIIHTHYYLTSLFQTISENYFAFGNTNYSALLGFIKDYCINKNEEVCIITFNYDTLLEKALERSSIIEFENIDSYINNEHIKLIKWHGSCNWAVKIVGELSKDILLHALNKTPGSKPDTIKYLNSFPQFPNVSPGITFCKEGFIPDKLIDPNLNNWEFYYPHIAIPMVSKTDNLIPDNHLQIAEETLKKSDEILIIGWKGAEKKFQDLLEKCIGDKPINFTIVNGCDTTVENNLIPILPNAKFSHFKNSFEDIDFAHHESGAGSGIYGKGSFSSYIKNIGDGKQLNFFGYMSK